MVCWHRILSGIVALVNLTVAYRLNGGEGLWISGIYLIFVLACIWFSEAMGNFVGGAGPLKTTRSNPALLRFMGWVLLLFPLVLLPLLAKACL